MTLGLKICVCVSGGGGEQKSVRHNLIPLHPVDIVLALLSKSGGGGHPLDPPVPPSLDSLAKNLQSTIEKLRLNKLKFRFFYLCCLVFNTL